MSTMPALINSVDHAFKLIALLAKAKEPTTVSMLAKQLGLPRPTIYRLLSTLNEHQIIIRDGHSYRLSLRLLELGETVLEATNIQALSQPFLTELAEQTGETAHFAILDGDKAGYVAKIDSTHPIRMSSRVGWRGPLHATAAGKVLLAWSGPELLTQICASQLARYTASTITDPAVLVIEIAEVRKQGYAVDNEELLDGLVCVAAPVLSGHRLVGAVSVSGPLVRVKDIASIARSTFRAAKQIATAF